MKRLSLDQVLKDNNTRDPNSISSLILTHRALSDVSCLGELKNLERLDLSANTLTSLEGLKSCANLKWLSVSQNKLQSLKGIEGLSKLTVLNAGNNKLTVMDEVMSVVSLRALILNDNEIASICRLEQMKELNTLVLSKNPIRDIGDALMNVKSIRKLSLSHCQLRSIQSSLKSCVELKELRLAHNNIEGLPAELAHNKGLQNLDLGNNVITRWSELKVLDSLVNLKNLNLQGNPVAEKDKLAKKYVLNPKGSTPAEVMGVDYKSTLKAALDSYSQKIKKDSVETLDGLILLQHQSSALSADIEEKRNDISTLQSRLDEVEAQLNSLRKETQDYTHRCEEEARNMMDEVKKEAHDMNIVEREAAEILKTSKLKLREVTKQTEEETQRCACELVAIIDSVSKYKEHVQSKIEEMNRDVSDTAAMLSDIHKGSLQSQYSFPFDSSQRSESTEAGKVYQLQ